MPDLSYRTLHLSMILCKKLFSDHKLFLSSGVFSILFWFTSECAQAVADAEGMNEWSERIHRWGITEPMKIMQNPALCCAVSLSHVWLCDPMDCSPPGSSVHGDSPGKNTAVSCHALLQGIFPTQRLNPGLPHCRQILYPLSQQGSPRILEWGAYPFSRGSSQPRYWTGVFCIAGGFFTSWAPREAHTKPHFISNNGKTRTLCNQRINVILRRTIQCSSMPIVRYFYFPTVFKSESQILLS